MSVMTEAVGERTLHRTIDWKKTFWIASGVPPLVLFSIGGIAAAAPRAIRPMCSMLW